MSAAIQNISLYIPHVFSNISSKKICDVFDFQGIGDVQKVDLIPKKDRNGRTYNAAHIHFKEWYDNIASRNFQERVLDKSKEARIVYDEPWYWIVLENKGRKFKPGDRKPTIDLNAFDYNSTKEKEQAKPTNYISPAQFKSALIDIIYSSKKPVQSVNEEVVKSYDDNYQYYCNYEEFSRSETLNNKTIEEYVDDLYEEFSLSDRHFESDEE
jgi:hypothetical protein